MLLCFILKVIGLILLILLCALFLLVCLILLVPIRYEAAGCKKSGEQSEIQCHGDIHWLFHIVQLQAGISGNTKQADVRILWFHPLCSKKKNLKSEEKQEIRSETVHLCNDANTKREAVTKAEKIEEKSEPSADKTAAECETAVPARDTETRHAKATFDSETATEDGKEKMRSEASSPAERAEEKPILQKIKQIFLTIPDRIKEACEKGSTLHAFIIDEENQEAMRLLASRAKYLLHHMRFRKLEGELTVGFDDPAMMGRIVGVASLFYPMFSDFFRITPIFDHAVCEGWFELKGHIRLIHIVLVLLQLFSNKRIRQSVFQHI